MDIAQLLTFSAKQGASDLHLSAGVEPMIRVDGDVKRINLPPLEHKQVHDMIYDIMNDKQRKAWDEFLETDFSFEIPGLSRFRVNAFTQNRGSGGEQQRAERADERAPIHLPKALLLRSYRILRPSSVRFGSSSSMRLVCFPISEDRPPVAMMRHGKPSSSTSRSTRPSTIAA